MDTTQMEQRRKKFLLLLPLIALPFSCLLFYAMGGGNSQRPETEKTGGLNTLLPSPQVDDTNPLDKLSLYRQAEADSAKQRKNQESDPFFSLSPSQEPAEDPISPDGKVVSPFSGYTTPASGATTTHNPDKQVADLQRKLAGLQQLVDHQTADTFPRMVESQPPLPSNTADLQRLEGLMNTVMDDGRSGADPELAQMSGMLDKILDIQHPGRVNERLRERSATTQGDIIPVLVSPGQPHAEYFGNPVSRKKLRPQVNEGETSKRPLLTEREKAVFDSMAHTSQQSPAKRPSFYGKEQPASDTVTNNTAIVAVVHESQTIVSGATIKIRLEQPVYVGGRLIPKGSFLFGVCSLSGERLLIDISSLRDNNLLFPVKLAAFDFDGNPGIRIPGSISRDASKQATDQAIQSVAMTTLDPSLGAQAASAGIETAKSLLSKKVRLIRVTVKADYPILLKSPAQL